MNGFLASILGWFQGTNNIGGKRTFKGYQVWTAESLESLNQPLSTNCVSALTEVIKCDDLTRDFISPSMRGAPGNATVTASVCDAGCGKSLKAWFDGVAVACADYTIVDAVPMVRGGNIWAGYNETCLRDAATGDYCHNIIDAFPSVSNITEMATNHICSDCWLKHLSIKQGSRYSGYDDFMKSRLEYSYSRCNQNNATAIPPPVINLPEPSNLCFAGEYTTVAGDTCDSIALAKNVSSAALYLGNPDTLANCNDIPAGTELCLPPSCEITHRLHSNETCRSIETNATIRAVVTLSPGDVKEYNPWLDYGCTNLHSASDAAFGHVICLSPQNGLYSGQPNAGDTTIPKPSSGYSDYWTAAPANATVATGTTLNCGEWHVAAADDTCMSILASTPGSTISIFMMVNPSLGTDITACSSLLVTGHAYCAVPHHAWDVPTPTSTSTATTTPSATATPVSYGCYSHTATSPLTGGVQNSDIQDANLMTPSFCANHCQQAGFTLFGLENGSSCFCGNNLSSGTKPTYPTCTVSCPGDSAQKCGGSSSTSLWGLDPLPPAVGAADQPSGALTYGDCRPNAGTTGYSFTGATLISATAMTPQLCGNFCKSRGFMLVAVQNGSEYRCALSGRSPAVTPVDDSQCDTPCSGDASKMCGSATLFNYYYWV